MFYKTNESNEKQYIMTDKDQPEGQSMTIIEEKPNNNRCKDFDNDCKWVKCHYSCWIGSELTDGPAKGYCPFIHGSN